MKINIRYLAAGGFIILIMLILYSFLGQKNETVSIINQSDASDMKLIIDNQSEYESTVSKLSFKSISSSIFNKIKNLSNGKQVTYNATIRKNSYVDIPSQTGTAVRFLVDIPNIKRTYVVSISRDDENDYIDILCPKDSDMIYAPFECKDIYDA